MLVLVTHTIKLGSLSQLGSSVTSRKLQVRFRIPSYLFPLSFSLIWWIFIKDLLYHKHCVRCYGIKNWIRQNNNNNNNTNAIKCWEALSCSLTTPERPLLLCHTPSGAPVPSTSTVGVLLIVDQLRSTEGLCAKVLSGLGLGRISFVFF